MLSEFFSTLDFENGRKGLKSAKIHGTASQDCQTKILMQNSFMDPLRKNKFGRFSRMDSGVFGSKLVKNGLKEVAKDINGLRQFPTFKEGP